MKSAFTQYTETKQSGNSGRGTLGKILKNQDMSRILSLLVEVCDTKAVEEDSEIWKRLGSKINEVAEESRSLNLFV